MEDFQIIALYWDRNEQAIHQTQIKYGKLCRQIGMNILGDAQDAEECEYDTYLAAWETMPPEKPKFLQAFLTKITRNLALKKLRWRSAKKRGGGEGEASLEELETCIPDGKTFQQALEARELGRALNKFLWNLPEQERNVFLCRYWACEPISQVARRFSFSQGKVKMMLMRTREKLRTYLQKEGYFV